MNFIKFFSANNLLKNKKLLTGIILTIILLTIIVTIGTVLMLKYRPKGKSIIANEHETKTEKINDNGVTPTNQVSKENEQTIDYGAYPAGLEGIEDDRGDVVDKEFIPQEKPTIITL